MEVYNVPDQGLVDMYMIQATQSNSQFAGQVEQFEPMYNEGTPEFYVDQGLYYPTAPNYGYICTGFESPGDWEEHHRVFGLDGLDVQYTGAANENVPYVYYPPGYGYGQSPYNPYNPYIPGAMIGVDGSFVAPQQYYALPSYENSVISSAYYPMARPEAIQNGTIDSSVDNGQSVNLIASQVAKQNLPSNFPNSTQAAVGDASSRRNSSMRGSERNRPYAESGKQTVPNFNSGSFLTTTSSQVLRARGPQRTEDVISGKMPSGGSSLKTPLPSANGLSGFESSDHVPSSVHRVKPKLFYGRVPDDVKVNPDALSEQNRGPRTNKSMNQLVVKARTTRAGNPDAQGNITIFTDQYNAIDFPIEYKNAKFFVIKSYSEDDVHKSIKYDVWSSTPNGNKKLNAAYEDAQRIAAGDLRGCPIFLFFSVNASGQFCGVAEMVGPVDFDRDMDFWQQDKWSGCFPVKWHIVKDLPNPNFRHIILENNENKPVTNSRDTQEIPYKKGLEMLKIFKNHTLKTSLLDDFMYYENRQRIMQEERARLLIKSYENPYFIPSLNPPRKLQTFRDIPSVGDLNGPQNEVNNFTIHKKQNAVTDGESSFTKNPHVSTGPASSNNTILNNSKAVGGSDQVVTNGVSNVADELQFSSLTINSREPGSKYPPSGTNSSTSANCESVGVVTIGSMPVKVNASQSSGFLTVGTIPLNPRALLRD